MKLKLFSFFILLSLISFAQVSTQRVHDSVDNITIERSSGKLQVKNSGIGSTQIADGSVTENKLGSGSVTNLKLGTGAVKQVNIYANAVDSSRIAGDAVTKLKLNSEVKKYTIAYLATDLLINTDNSYDNTLATIDRLTFTSDDTIYMRIPIPGRMLGGSVVLDSVLFKVDAIGADKITTIYIRSNNFGQGAISYQNTTATGPSGDNYIRYFTNTNIYIDRSMWAEVRIGYSSGFYIYTVIFKYHIE